MLSCSFQNGPKEGRKEGGRQGKKGLVGKKEGTKTVAPLAAGD